MSTSRLLYRVSLLVNRHHADAIKKHKKTYEDSGDEEDDKSMGTAAAMQALKLFNKGETKSSSSSQSAFLGLAMAEASKVSYYSP